MAVSPPHMYSRAAAASPFTQPVPVVVASTSTLRSKAPVRSSSATASSSSVVSWLADCRPTYTRIGSRAGFPVAAVISMGSGPCETNQRPSEPRVSHLASDAGLPERSGFVGCTAYSVILSLRTLKAELATAKNARVATPLNRVTMSTVSSSAPVAGASVGGTFTHRLSSRASRRTAARSVRYTATTSAPTAKLSAPVRRYAARVVPSMPIRPVISRCQSAESTSMRAATRMQATTTTTFAR